MGIADFGLTGPQSNAGVYSYASSMFEGRADVNSLNVSIPFHGASLKNTAFELNVMLVLNLGGTNFTYWIQNGLHVNASSRLFSIGGAYVWNFSSPGAHLTSSEVKGNSSSVLASDTYYFIPNCGVFAGQCTTLSWPDSFTGRVITSTSSGTPFVDYQYNLGSGWVTYDNVSFPHMTGATDTGFVVDGHHATPIGSNEFYDAEWVWVAAYGGLSSVVQSSDVRLSLDYWNGANLQAVPNAWDFGGDTGETSSNVTESVGVAGAGEAPAADLTNGAGSLGILYNQSSVGYLELSTPSNETQVVWLSGAPVLVPPSGVNLTLTGGPYILALQNYSNATLLSTVTPGSTTFVNFSGAGRTTFVESGLPIGTNWSLSIGGISKYSMTSSLDVNLPNGTFALSFGPVSGYHLNSSAPNMLTIPASALVTVHWDPFLYAVPITESGLPTGTTWWVLVDGIESASDGALITENVSNGSTPFTVGSLYAFVATPTTGSINVSAGQFDPISIQFAYRATYIAGTVSPASATVTIDGVGIQVTGGSFNYSVVPGSYNLSVSAAGYASQSIEVNATAGNVTVENIHLKSIPPPPSTITNTSSSPDLTGDYLIGGLVVAGVVIVAVLALLFMRRPKKP